MQHLTEDEHVASQSTLEHDGHVAGVEQFDGVGRPEAPRAVAGDWDLNPEALEVDDGSEDDNGGKEVADVRKTFAVECLLESTRFVVPGEEKMEERDNGTLKFGSTAGVDGGGRESLPDDRLADVGSDEERDTGTNAVPLLEELVEEDDNESGDH